jgi:hypothetical protein
MMQEVQCRRDYTLLSTKNFNDGNEIRFIKGL